MVKDTKTLIIASVFKDQEGDRWKSDMSLNLENYV